MVYGGKGDKEIVKIRCDMCCKFSNIHTNIERYDESIDITGWNNEVAHPLKTFCSKSCVDKYFNENQ